MAPPPPLREIKIPVILYDTEGDKVPHIEVPIGEKMPPVLLMFEYRHTGETEPGPKGEDVQIVDQHLHWYADMTALEENLDANTYDQVRVGLGLQPLAVARRIAAENKAKRDAATPPAAPALPTE